MDPLDERLKSIEKRLEALEKWQEQHQPPSKLEQESDAALLPPPPQVKEPNLPSKLGLWLQEYWLTAIGIFLVLLSGTWFVGYAFANVWFGETARIVICFSLGALAYIWGLLILKKRTDRGRILVILGGAVSMAALFAGHELYGMLPLPYMFALMFGITALTAVIAVVGEHEPIGFASVFAAMVIPLLVETSNPNHLFLVNYVLLVDGVALFMLLMRGWGWTFHVAWLATLILFSYSLDFLSHGVAYAYMATFYLLFFIPTGLIACEKIMPRLPLKGALLLLTTTFALILWMESRPTFNWHLIFYLGAASLTFFFCYVMSVEWDQIHRHTPIQKRVLASLLGFSIMAYLFTLTDHVVASDYQTIAYLLEGVMAISIGCLIFRSPIVGAGLSFCFLIPLLVILHKLLTPPSLLYASLYSLDFVNLLVADASLAIASWMLYTPQVPKKSPSFRQICLGGLIVIASMLLMCLVWNISHNLIHNPSIARGTALVIYILGAEYLIYLGNLKGLVNLRIGGIVVILYVIGRLFFEEVWVMPVVIRTVTFVITGLLLIGTAWFDKKTKKASDNRLDRGDDTHAQH